MATLDAQMKVGECVATWPSTAKVFETCKIDYCCGGGQTIGTACATLGVPVSELVRKLHAAVADSADAVNRAEPAWMDEPLAELCDHIVDTHHSYLRAELPRLAAWVDKVCRVHGAHHPELYEVQTAFATLQAELVPHMFKEEQILFPAICQLERSRSALSFPFGSVANPVRMMEHEHSQAGAMLAIIRRATKEFTPPSGACNTFIAMLHGLRELEENMHQHVHKENNILFPRAIAMERSLQTSLDS